MSRTVIVTLRAPSGEEVDHWTLDYPQAIADSVMIFAAAVRCRPHEVEYTVTPRHTLPDDRNEYHDDSDDYSLTA